LRSEGSNGRPGLPHERLAHPTLVRLSDEAGLGAEHAARKRIVASLLGERVDIVPPTRTVGEPRNRIRSAVSWSGTFIKRSSGSIPSSRLSR